MRTQDTRTFTERTPSAPEARAVARAPTHADSILQLQRTAGNRAVTAMLSRCSCGGHGACCGGGGLEELLDADEQRR